MKIKLISIGKVRVKHLLAGEEEYLKRLKLLHVELIELDNERWGSLSEQEQKEREAKLLLGKLKESDYLVALDQHGKEFESNQIATWLQKRMNQGSSAITFAIGGPYGWHNSVLERANMLLSLSKLTFTYQMSRLILVEQLYRVETILTGKPYHK